MKPPIEYRPKTVPVDDEFLGTLKTAERAVLTSSELEMVYHGDAPPAPKVSGRWIYVSDDQMVTFRDRSKTRSYFREYQRKLRAKRKAAKHAELPE